MRESPQKTWFIKFPAEASRERFLRAFQGAAAAHAELAEVRLEPGEFLPDVIAFHVSDRALSVLRALVGPEARFVEDFAHTPFD